MANKECPERIFIEGEWFKRMIGGNCKDCACRTTHKPADRLLNPDLCNKLPMTCLPEYSPEGVWGYFVKGEEGPLHGRSEAERAYLGEPTISRKMQCVCCKREFDVYEVNEAHGGKYLCEDCRGLRVCLPEHCELHPLDECSACNRNPHQEG